MTGKCFKCGRTRIIITVETDIEGVYAELSYCRQCFSKLRMTYRGKKKTAGKKTV